MIFFNFALSAAQKRMKIAKCAAPKMMAKCFAAPKMMANYDMEERLPRRKENLIISSHQTPPPSSEIKDDVT